MTAWQFPKWFADFANQRARFQLSVSVKPRTGTQINTVPINAACAYCHLIKSLATFFVTFAENSEIGAVVDPI